MDNYDEVIGENGKILTNSLCWNNLSNRHWNFVYCVDCESDIRYYLWGERE